jgi:chitodextrinase
MQSSFGHLLIGGAVFILCAHCCTAPLPAAWRPALVAEDAPLVPAVYQDLYDSLDNYLKSFDTLLNAGALGSYPTVHAAELPAGDANGGPEIISSTSRNLLRYQLQEMKAMGLDGVMVKADFPVLYKPYLESQGQDYKAFVKFYADVAASARALGMKLIVENSVLTPSDAASGGWDVTTFYKGLSWPQYIEARAQTAQIVAQTMQPDYLVLMEEPSTEANNTTQSNANTPGGASALVSAMLTSVSQAGVKGLQMGAGVATYESKFAAIIQKFVALPLNFIDMHIYQVNFNDLPNALAIAGIASAAGMPVTISECWLKKLRDSEVGVLSSTQSRARDPFSFWAPLDRYFIQTVEKLAGYTQMRFMAPFGAHYFWTYLPYDGDTKKMHPNEILLLEDQQANTAVQQPLFTSTGMSYYHSLVSPPDTTPPAAPSGVTAGSASPTQASVHWNAATDNVGVAGYTVWRDGTSIAQTAGTGYQDTGLQEATTYTYTIEAFDVAGNISAPSEAVQVTTKDTTPPTTPTNLAGTPVSSVKIALTWTASTDPVGIRSYRIFSGPSANNLTQISDTVTTSLTLGQFTPATTYYFGVEAVDNFGLVSNMSQVVQVATYPLPSPPAKVKAAALSSSQIGLNWPAATGSLPIARYLVYKGTSPDKLHQEASTTSRSYTDRSLNSSTTYYYAIQAVDTQNDISAMSETASATTEP